MCKRIFSGLLFLFLLKISVYADIQFTPNMGQWEARALYKVDFKSARLFLEQNRMTFLLWKLENKHPEPVKAKLHALSIEFLQANPDCRVEGSVKNQGYSNYYLGNDPQKWASGVPSFSVLTYYGLYEHTDVQMYSAGGHFKYD